MRLIDDLDGIRLVTSASDLKAAAECEFAWLRAIDARLKRVSAVEEPVDVTLERTKDLGLQHEYAVLADYRERYGDAVIDIPGVRSSDAVAMATNVALTRAALDDPDAQVVYQATFLTREFVGFADFLVRDEQGRWIVQDTKLARRARVTALMQLAAYVDQLDQLGIVHSDRVELLLGDGSTSVHAVDDLLPVFRLRRARLHELIAGRDLEARAAGAPVAWGDDRYLACGRCATCEAEVLASRDLLMVAGMRPVQRDRLRAASITTLDALAAAATVPEGMNSETFESLKTQAMLQLQTEQRAAEAGTDVPPVYEVVAPRAIAGLPRPDLGDIFFDFEGDPLYTEGEGRRWGIDYLFGWVDIRDEYSAIWAHSFDEEKRAFEDFLDFVAVRRAAHPRLHIYHYAPYETSHLTAMAARYGVREGEVDRLLRDGVFVDLYPVVRRALRVGSRSYSIKKLEPLYMAARTTEVQRGDDSIVRYVEARALADISPGRPASEALAAHPGAAAVLADIAGYNRDDCVSTRLLRDWLVDRAREAGLVPATEPELDDRVYDPSPRALALLARADLLAEEREASLIPSAGDEVERTPDESALRLGAAAIDYYPREAKSFWATHFLRLREPISLWEQTRDVIVVDADRSQIVEDWHRPEGARSDRRHVEIRGEFAPGTRLSEGGEVFLVYDLPAPFPVEISPRFIHAAHPARVLEVRDDGALVEEYALKGHTWHELPAAVTPPAPPQAGNQQRAIDDWADSVIGSDGFPADPATDLLRRQPPRTSGGRGVIEAGMSDVDAVTAWVRALDHSYLAVQGPPGTGKTFVGARVIERLVREHGYKVGVVAQSHAAVENVLDEVVRAGVAAEMVGKAIKGGAESADGSHSFTVIEKAGLAAFTEAHAGTGYVVGGTAWDFSHRGRVPRESLDLLVIDEAGQFSLASTIAVSLAATRLLLLGDPQQLPQVSQGTHPEPVDTSALGWIMGADPVLDPLFGRFLAQTRRMHPDVAVPVSHLAYAGRLEAHPSAALRAIEGYAPGLHVQPIAHRGNATFSLEEADEVVRLVGDLLGRAVTDIAWHDDGSARILEPRPLTQADIIVVTPYNAQQQTVHDALLAAGFGDVRVGTVDKFQGQEALVSIVSLAASGARDAPRGPEFLLLQNRLNVAISRAQVASFLIYSPGLLDDLPRTPEGVARLSAFARLVEAPDALGA